MKIVFLVFSALACFSAHGASVVVAEYVASPTNSWGFNAGAGIGADSGRVYDNRQGQTFLATTSGYLETVSFNVEKISTNADLKVSITRLVNGQPGELLHSMYLAHSSASTSVTTAFIESGKFSNSVTASESVYLDAGTTYAIVFSTDLPQANYRFFGSRSSNYTGGHRLYSQNSSEFEIREGDDFFFRVTAVPEPSPVLLSGMAGIGLAARRSRRVKPVSR